MGSSDSTLAQLIADARTRLRERTLPALTTALLLQISIATARKSYDLRALSSAFGLLVLIVLALLGATVDAVLTFAVALLRDVTRVRVRFGPAAPVIVAPPPPITENMLLDKRGRPLRGAPRTKRIALLERERLALAAAAAATAAAAKPAFHVIELPPLPPRLVAAYARARALVLAASARAIAASRAAARAADRVGALVPSIPVPTLPVRWIRIVSVTMTMTFVFATAIGTTGIIAQQGTIALGASTTLSIISGDVSARTADSTDFRPIADGALLRAGMAIRTGDNTYAVLTYFEGSTVSIEPNTTLVIEALGANPDGSTVISMQQQVGRTWHSVTKLLNPGSKYEVKTPTLTATVRGTAFEVGVDQDAATGEIVSSVVTTEGAVGAAKPATAADPTPPEVIVPAGFQATAKAAEPVAPPEPAPEPERKVTVTVGTSNAVVVDPLGRANGEKDGKLVLQTPGAKVTKVDGKLVIMLPNIPDGKISTVIAPTTQQASQGPVSVGTVVSEKGKGEARSEETVQAPASASAAAVVTGVELKKSDSAQPAEVRVLNAAENKESKAPKLPEPPKPSEAPKPELLPTPEKKDEAGKSESREGAKVSNVVDVFVKATLPPLSVEDSARRAEEARKAEERAKEEAARREEQRRKENEERAEAARQAEAKAKEESSRLTEERRKAEERAREELTKRDVARGEQTVRGGASPVESQPPRSGGNAQGDAPKETPAPQNAVGGLVQNILKAITPGNDDDAARKETEKKAEEARKAEEKAKDEAAKLGDERRKAEETQRQDAIKKAEAERKAAEQKTEELKKAEEKAKEESAKELQRVREIEAKAREQSQKLEEEKRKEAEKRLEEFRKAEEKTREEAAKRLEEQRKAEEQAKAAAERKLEELRQAQEKAKEEAARAEEERKREEQRKAEEKEKAKAKEEKTSNFIPAQTIDPLPGRLGSNERGSNERGSNERGSNERGRGNSGR